MPVIPAIGVAMGATAGTAAATSLGAMTVLGAAGVGASVYGANKAAKTAKATNAANIQASKDADQLAYRRWLETQGVGDQGQAINTWLPRYATVSQPFGGSRKFRARGSAPSMSPDPAVAPEETQTPDPSSPRFGSFAGGLVRAL